MAHDVKQIYRPLLNQFGIVLEYNGIVLHVFNYLNRFILNRYCTIEFVAPVLEDLDVCADGTWAL